MITWKLGFTTMKLRTWLRKQKKVTMIGEILHRDVSVPQVRSVINLHKNWKGVKHCMLWKNSKKLSS